MELKNSWFEFSPSIKVEKLGYVHEAVVHPTRNGVPYWVLVLLQKGCRTLLVDGMELRVDTNMFFLLPPYTEQRPIEVDDHVAYYAHFYADGTPISKSTKIDASRCRLLLYGKLPPDVYCVQYMKYLYDHSISPYASDVFLSAQLYNLMSIIGLQCQKNPYAFSSRCANNASDYLTYIKLNSNRVLRAEDYEAAFGKSYHQINQVFKRQFGATVKQYHMRVRMAFAAQELLSGKSIRSVAETCGFEDYFFFIRCFTKAFGISPSAYRKNHGM